MTYFDMCESASTGSPCAAQFFIFNCTSNEERRPGRHRPKLRTTARNESQEIHTLLSP
jgi:hypothetical protein